MTENTPAAAEQALPSRRARRAAQNSEGPGVGTDSVRERPEPAAPQAAAPGAGTAEPAGQAAADYEQPLTRRRARAELRSWGTGSAAAGSAGVPEPPVLLIEQEPVHGDVPEEPGEHQDAATSGRAEPGTDADLQTAPEAEAEAEAEAKPEAEAEPEPEPEPDAEAERETAAGAEPAAEPEAVAAAEPEAVAAAEPDPADPEAGPEPRTGAIPAPEEGSEHAGDGQRRAVVLPELPVAPPAGSAQEAGDTSADTAAAEGNEADIETETARPAKEPGQGAESSEVEGPADTREPAQQAGQPDGLPLDAVLMPSDLRERTRLAVRGEPNDVRRATFLDTQTAKIPATRGFRGFLASLGIRISPSARELDERQDTRTVSQHWPGPRTISVVNGKGGANKTPTTVMLAAIFARNGGGPVLAWDNNETRGTLGWRTEQAQHDATVMDLLPETGLLLSPAAQSAMLAKFVHHQTDDKYDVLRSNPNVLASEQKVTRADFDALHAVASKYFRLNIVDSGNDESAERWLRMIDHTDQLVIATTTVEEHAEAGALLLEALQERGGRYAELARGAVVIVSQADRNGTEAQARRVAEAFKVLARAAVTIPYDPALVKGQIRYASLRPATQRAWLKAAAAVAGGL
ncbi:AAA family ATPase [Arthrobacter sp. NPDC055585]